MTLCTQEVSMMMEYPFLERQCNNLQNRWSLGWVVLLIFHVFNSQVVISNNIPLPQQLLSSRINTSSMRVIMMIMIITMEMKSSRTVMQALIRLVISNIRECLQRVEVVGTLARVGPVVVVIIMTHQLLKI